MADILPNFANFTGSIETLVEFNDTILLDTFINVLIEVSTEQLRNIRSNVITNYELQRGDVNDIKRAFNNIEEKYTEILQKKLQKMMESEHFNVTDHFMIDFMDVSNYILERVLQFHIKNVKGKMISNTKWYKQTLKEKILRQQTKISFNFIENHICDTLQVCRDRYYYSDYLIDWLRSLMNLGFRDLKRFFMPVPEILEKHKHFIQSNIKFRQTIKYIINSEALVKRDTLDFIDEVLTNPDKVLKLSPTALKPSVVLLRELFSLIDGAYDVNDQNVENLEKITEMLRDWIDGSSFDIHKVFDAIVENMKLNLKIWPLDVQNRIYYVWSAIIIL
ncbi:unnamed protein product [Chrysodeixis includens]|uniref:Uncharacterized protein n=1 Tax=Chrysodeixis includens TaxID=689277 RepID=A0A9N8KNW6_CHRIL|nr:unnamed protein product [Chrysodeixis includens]